MEVNMKMNFQSQNSCSNNTKQFACIKKHTNMACGCQNAD